MSFNLEAVIRLRDEFTGNMKRMKEQAEKFKESMGGWDKVQKNVKNAGQNASKYLTLPLTGVATASIATVSSFDDSMAKVRSISGATGEDFEKLRELAQELGSTTAHSASAAADGMSYLALAGWDTNQIIAATPKMLDLASAASMDLATAADIVSDTMSQFSMEAEEAGRAADVFAKIQASANTDVNQLGEAMKYAGGAAASAGMDLEQTTAMLGVFANTSLKGSQAGTTFTAMLTDMRNNASDGAISIGDMAVALYDAEGNMRDMGSVMADVEKATEGMTTAQRDAALSSVYGVQAMKGVNAILSEGTDAYYELEEAARNSAGYSSEAATEMENTIGGAFRGMRSAIEGLMISIGDELKPYVQMGTEMIKEWAGKFRELDSDTKRVVLIIGGLVAAIGPVLMMVSMAIKVGQTLATVFRGLAAAKVLFSAALWASPITWVVGLIVGLIAVGVLLWKNWDTVKERASELWANLTNVFGGIRDGVGNAMESLKNSVLGTWGGIKSGIRSAVNGIIGFINRMIEGINSFGIDIPSWVPERFGGGQSLSFNIPTIPEIGGSHYYGLDEVPYDGYLARTHKGEAILDRQEAEAWREGRSASPSISITGNTFNVRQESDIDAIANALFKKIKTEWEGGV